MPKVDRVRRYRAKDAYLEYNSNKSVQNPKDGSVKNNANIGSAKEGQVLSRGQRKRQAKRDQYLKRENMVLNSLQVKRMEEQKGKIDGLDAIKEALKQALKQEIIASEKGMATETIIKTNKSKEKLAQKEVSHMNLVLEHPSFQINPFATIQEHLKNSLGKEAEEQQTLTNERKKLAAKLAKEKKEIKKNKLNEFKWQKMKAGSRKIRR